MFFGVMFIFRTFAAGVFDIHHITVSRLIGWLDTVIPLVENGSFGFTVESEVDFGEVILVLSLYFFVVVVVLVVVVVEALRGEEVVLGLGEGGKHERNVRRCMMWVV